MRQRNSLFLPHDAHDAESSIKKSTHMTSFCLHLNNDEQEVRFNIVRFAKRIITLR